MSVTMLEAQQIVRKNLPGCKIVASIEHDGKYLFIAHWQDLLEGKLDPFFSVEKSGGYFRDFSPQDYPNPLEVITRLDDAANL
jgi:hypothetical protein